jgi:hypothetical protein
MVEEYFKKRKNELNASLSMIKENKEISMKEYLNQQNEKLKSQIETIQEKINEVQEMKKEIKTNQHMHHMTKLNHINNLSNYNYLNFQNNDNNLNELFHSKYEEIQTLKTKINFYKEAIGKIKSQMDNFYNIKKIESLENELKVKKENLKILLKENVTLNNISKNQMKGINQFSIKNENTSEMHSLKYKINMLKEEYKDQKEINRQSEIKLKEKSNMVIQFEEKCKKMKEKIERFKNTKESTGNGDLLKKENEMGDLTEGDLLEIEEKINLFEQEILQEEKSYKNELFGQENLIAQLNNEILEFSQKLKEKENEEKLYEIKTKEVNRINKSKIPSNNKRDNSLPKINNRSLSASGKGKVSSNNEKMNKVMIKNNIPVNMPNPNGMKKKRLSKILLDQINYTEG